MSNYYYWGGYTPSTPIEVEGGIKAKSKRGSIGDTWWSKRWVSILESFGWSSRLDRGKKYARKGQVLEFNLMPGKVEAKAQGSIPKPYSVTIEVQPFTDENWDNVIKAMSQKAIFAAKLLAGEMPHDIEDAFNSAGVSLFPDSSKSIKTRCSCPDSANPCKHIAAVYYIIAEEFDRDPFILFNLRGRTQEEITEALRKSRTMVTESPSESEKRSDFFVDTNEIGGAEGEDSGDAGNGAKLSVGDFWSGKELESFSVDISPPDVPAAIIKRLGTPKFWDSKNDFDAVMGIFYTEVSRHAIKFAYSESMGSIEDDAIINWDADAVIEEETNDVEVYLLKVTLAHSKPPIWRRILVMGDITMSKFHLILQNAMGWSDSHPHMFLVDGEYYGESDSDNVFNSRDERTVKLNQLILEEGNKFSYMYDFGDSWEHDILVEKILTSYPDVHYPVCIKGKRACPPEDCGGIGGYHYLLDVLEDPDDLRYEDMIEWIGWDFDPNDFDIDDINVRLSLIT
ncbi:MAG: SWIM zinc finger family protein [Methanosarcinaceae archaeon]|nr:SWIM zinc finger family protein [Methanosarcinaceae archaeon]